MTKLSPKYSKDPNLLTREARCEVEDVERAEKELIGSTECEQNWSHVVEPHDGIGREISDLVGGISCLKRGVHLDPVTGDVQGYQELEHKQV